jgi:hypothetical protein
LSAIEHCQNVFFPYQLAAADAVKPQLAILHPAADCLLGYACVFGRFSDREKAR